MTKIAFDCDRCTQPVTGLHGGSYTAGFYVVSGDSCWKEYRLSEDEHFVCDACVQSMPSYRQTYGLGPITPEEQRRLEQLSGRELA